MQCGAAPVFSTVTDQRSRGVTLYSPGSKGRWFSTAVLPTVSSAEWNPVVRTVATLQTGYGNAADRRQSERRVVLLSCARALNCSTILVIHSRDGWLGADLHCVWRVNPCPINLNPCVE